MQIQNTGYQGAPGTQWVLQQHKKTKTEVKVTLSERKVYREPMVEGRELRFKSTIWNSRKKNTFNQNTRGKKNSEKQG